MTKNKWNKGSGELQSYRKGVNLTYIGCPGPLVMEAESQTDLEHVWEIKQRMLTGTHGTLLTQALMDQVTCSYN